MMEYEVEVDGEKHRVRFFEREGELHVEHAHGTFPVRMFTPLRSRVQRVQLDGEALRFGYHHHKEGTDIVLDGVVYRAVARELEHVLLAAVARRKSVGGHAEVKAPMPGMVVSVRVKAGDVVKKGESLLSLHAMKLENDIRSPREGVVEEVRVKAGDVLEKGAVMVRLGPLPEEDPTG
jgi:biotin carboxyl carrier protein